MEAGERQGLGEVELALVGGQLSGADLDDDIRRFRKAREVCGPDFPIAIDANQRWEVSEAIEWVNALAEFHPAWIEEPTSPDDVLGHAEIARGIAPIRVATGGLAASDRMTPPSISAMIAPSSSLSTVHHQSENGVR